MTRVVVKKLVWDKYNIEHIKEHKVTVSEVESLARSISAHKKAKQGRYLIIGRVGLRILSVIINRTQVSHLRTSLGLISEANCETRDRKGVGIYYPVTARDSAKKERRRLYEKEKKQTT